MDLEHKEILSYLDYNPITGSFTWKIKPNNRIVIGSTAGNRDNTGYIRLRFKKKNYLIHRLAFLFMEGELPAKFVDHVNGDRTDNRWENLRLVDKRGNGKNTKLRVDNTSGKVGVSWSNLHNKWIAQISNNEGVRTFLGLFTTVEEAITAREEAEIDFNYHKNHGKR